MPAFIFCPDPRPNQQRGKDFLQTPGLPTAKARWTCWPPMPCRNSQGN